MSVRRVERGSSQWPTQLEDLDDETPETLWCVGEGDLRLLALRSIAIVGCRSASPYGRAVASDLAASLSSRGWSIISGAAFGVDAAAHRGALAAGGCTIAVLPGGPDVPVPQAHAGLLDQIAGQGLIISDREPGVGVRRHMFLIRNRIIAAMARAVLVVEADIRSGALNTARRAGDLGRLLLATPGPVTTNTSRGTHDLIRSRRAELVTSAEDVLDLVEPLGREERSSPSEPVSSQQGFQGALELGSAGVAGTDRGDVGSRESQRVSLALGTEPSSLSDLARAVDLPEQSTLRELQILRLRGQAQMTTGGWLRLR